MKINPTAFLFWVILTIIGYLVHSTLTGTLSWLLGGLIISLISSAYDMYKEGNY